MEFQLVKTSEFKFRTKLLKEYEMELPFAEHTEELRQRFFQLIYIFLFISGVIFTNVTVFVKILENPVEMERKINNGTKHAFENIEKLSATVDDLDDGLQLQPTVN